MQSLDLVIEHKIEITPRVLQIQGMMDYEDEFARHEIKIDDVDIDYDWNIGLIVGSSGSGKTTIARNIFSDSLYQHKWGDKALVDEFPAGVAIKDVTAALTRVGLGSIPAWLRPYSTLSNGEKFRADIAMSLFSENDIVCIDEFTSVVDRTVAKIASNSVQKTFRQKNKKLIAVSCHYDIIEWLQPDWIIDVQDRTFRRCLWQGRPKIELSIRTGTMQEWEGVKHHHYMSGEMHKGAKIITAYHNDRLVAIASYIHFPHPKAKNIKVGHRTVVVPDYQGLGIGLILDNYIGTTLKARGFRYRNTTAHPAMVKSYLKSNSWICDRRGRTAMSGKTSSTTRTKKTLKARQRLASRITASFEYVGV